MLKVRAYACEVGTCNFVDVALVVVMIHVQGGLLLAMRSRSEMVLTLLLKVQHYVKAQAMELC